MSYVRGKSIGLEVLRAIGINRKGVADFSIEIPVNGAVRVRAEILLNEEDVRGLVRVLREYKFTAHEQLKEGEP